MTVNPWHKQPMMAWDLETTGVDVDADRIVTSTIVVIDKGVVRTREWLVNPGIDIPEGAAAVHGITTAKAQAEGMDSATAVAEIYGELKAWLRTGRPVIVFNGSFDFTVLDRECRRNTVTALGAPIPVIDPFVMDKELDKWRKGKRTLTATCEHYKVKLDGAHDATQDALAAARVAWRMAERWPRELQIDLAELHSRQQRWRFVWAEQFQEYLQKKDPDALVNGEWPVQSLPAGWDPAAHPVEQAIAS